MDKFILSGIDLIDMVNNEPPIKFIWDNIPEGSKGLFTGNAKTGKTTFAENLAISIAAGRNNFFGKKIENSTPKRVLFINLEENYRIRGRRAAKQIHSLNNVELANYRRNFLTINEGTIKYIDNEEDWQLISNLIESSNADIIFFDSLTHMFKGEIEKSQAAREFFKNVENYIWSHNKTTIFIHHNVKGNNVSPGEQHSIAGSRIISQEFEYAYNFSKIPGRDNENYCNMLFNKHTPDENSVANIYTFNEYGWVEFKEKSNKYSLSLDSKNVDGRNNSENKELIFNLFKSLTSQSNQETLDIKTATLIKELVPTKMSKDTFFTNIKKLTEDGLIEKSGNGIYSLKPKVVVIDDNL